MVHRRSGRSLLDLDGRRTLATLRRSNRCRDTSTMVRKAKLTAASREEGHRVVVADIGGTNARVQYWEVGDTDELLHTHTFATKDFPSLESCLDVFLQDAMGGQRPDAACFAVAGPVEDGVCMMTNAGWKVDKRAIAAGLDIPLVGVLNDFEAVGYGVQGLSEDSLVALNEVQKVPKAPCVCLGPGTGLGEALMFWDESAQSYKVHPTEGGHVGFAPRGWKQRALHAFVENQHGFCEMEHILSGSGLKRIYDFLRTDPETHRQGIETPDLEPAQISEAGLNDTNQLCRESVDLFLSILGAEAGNMGLKVLARGGVYIAGGVTPKLMPRMKMGAVLEEFLNYPNTKFHPLLKKIPLYAVIDEGVGLLGTKVYAKRFLLGTRQ